MDINLKKVLMDLGNELVLNYGYDPATTFRHNAPNTKVIKDFTDWMNDSPEACLVLKKLGLDWPIAAVPKDVACFGTGAIYFGEQRLQIAKKMFAEWDFEPDVIKDTGNWNEDKDMFTMNVFVENGDDPSIKKEFSVRFLPNSTEIQEVIYECC